MSADLLPNAGVEYLYAITPNHLVDKRISQTDSKELKRTLLTADKTRVNLSMRVHRDNLDSLITFLEAHRKADGSVGNPWVDLNTPGMYPFGVNFTRSETRLLEYSGFQKINEIIFETEATFEFVAGIS
jgi:hypothetical protein